jgi:TRAP-type uncharacterized transport system substrate-binding protein
VPANSDIKSIKDLKGKPVALPARGNTSLSAGWEYLLKINGMTLNDLGPKSYGPVSSNAEAVKNRQAMATGWFTVVPASFVLDLGSAMQLRMIGVTPAELAELKKINGGSSASRSRRTPTRSRASQQMSPRSSRRPS